MGTVVDLVKGLQKEKMQRRQVVHPQGDYSGLVEDLGKDILPVEYGGTNGSVEDLAQFWRKEVEASAEWLKTQVFDLANIHCREDTLLYIISLRNHFTRFNNVFESKTLIPHSTRQRTSRRRI